MLKPQKKITKKEIKEDKFVKFALETKAYLEENSKQVSIVLGAILIIVIGYLFYSYQHGQTMEKASALLGEAQAEYQNLNNSKAKKLLTELIDQYSGTRPANQGLLLLANIYFNENNTEEAVKYFQQFIDSYGDDDFLMASGYAGYAACLEKQKKYAEAAKYYQKAQETAPEFVEAANYLYLAALNLEDAGNFDQARELLQKIIDDYPESNRVEDAKAQLILLASK